MSSIIIHGRHALLFDDDANAAFVNSREALVPFSGDDSCLIDRYDARHLLDRIPPRPVNKNQKYIEDTAGIDQEELDRERFLDLPLDEDDGLAENEDYERGDTERSEPKSSSSYQAVGFSYHNNDDSSDQKNSESNDSVFSPPFAVPKDLLNNLMLAAEEKLLQKPCTEKLHQIMARTAIFVSDHGGQSEIVLRVKQGGNPTFGFLMPDNQLHPYFRFLVKHPQLLKHDNTLEKKNSDNGGALSLLGSMYGTGEDDENANDDDSKDESKKRGKEEPSFEKEPTMQKAVVISSKEKSVVPKKSNLIVPSTTGRKKDGTTAKVGKKTDAKPVILEPPTFLKRNIDKAVEFIQKNGRKFEAKLIEQDKTIGRFPFLLATNQYHSYYLKVLEEALESKCSDSNTKRKSEEIMSRDETVPDELVDDLPFNPHKKEKFTMLLGNNTRREIVDQPSKPVQQSGVTADEAAMIVLAATRGQSPFPSTSTNDSDSKNLSLNKEKTSEVNSKEANLSEATMTKEQKIKAERLKRAKMFAAMIKSGAQPIPPANESKLEESNHAPVNERKNEEVNAAEPKLEEFDEASAKERNYRKKNIEEEEEDDDSDKHSKMKLHSEDKESKHHHRHGHRRHKNNHYSEDEDEHSKNHRRRRHRRRSHRKHSDSDSEDEDDYKETRNRRRSHRKYSDSEDEDKYEKSSRHKRSKHDLSEDEDRDRSHKHRRKHHRSPMEKEDLEEGELFDVANAASVKSSDHTATEVPSDLRAKVRAMLLETL